MTTDQQDTDGIRACFLASLKESEGFSDTPYRDTRGIWTVGFGHKIGKELPDNIAYTRDELLQFFDDDVKAAEGGAKRLFEQHAIRHLTPGIPTYWVVVEMVFILGEKGTSNFHQFWNKLRLDDLPAAAEELRTNSHGGPSPWYEEEPHRVDKLANRLLNGF